MGKTENTMKSIQKKGRETPTKTNIKLSLSLRHPMMNYKYIIYLKKLTKQDISHVNQSSLLISKLFCPLRLV